MTEPFWQRKSVQQLSDDEWESLCDGCGKCCLHKLEDEDDGQVYYTDVACRYLDCQSGQCSDYPNRLRNVAECLNLTPHNLAEYSAWLPASCAYKLVGEGQPLPQWHPLVSGQASSVAAAGACVAGKVLNEQLFSGDLEDRIIYWIDDINE